MRQPSILAFLALALVAPLVVAQTGTDVCGEGATALIVVTGSLECEGVLVGERTSTQSHRYVASAAPGDVIWFNLTPAASIHSVGCIMDGDHERQVCDSSKPDHRVAMQALHVAEVIRMSLWSDVGTPLGPHAYGLEIDWVPASYATQTASGTLRLGRPLDPQVELGAAGLPAHTAIVALEAPMRPGQEIVFRWDADLPAAVRFQPFNLTAEGGHEYSTLDCEATGPRERTCRHDRAELWRNVRLDWVRVAMDYGVEADWSIEYTYWRDADLR